MELKHLFRTYLRERHVNLLSLCNAYGLPYKTIWAWLNGYQKKLRPEIEAVIITIMEEK
jgi:hypothetical protein